jgi:hypothetical protein
MVGGKSAAVGIDRKVAVEAQPAAADEGAALAAFAEAQILQSGEDGDRDSRRRSRALS